MISLRLKNPVSPFIFLAKPNSVKFLMTDLGLKEIIPAAFAKYNQALLQDKALILLRFMKQGRYVKTY